MLVANPFHEKLTSLESRAQVLEARMKDMESRLQDREEGKAAGDVLALPSSPASGSVLKPIPSPERRPPAPPPVMSL